MDPELRQLLSCQVPLQHSTALLGLFHDGAQLCFPRRRVAGLEVGLSQAPPSPHLLNPVVDRFESRCGFGQAAAGRLEIASSKGKPALHAVLELLCPRILGPGPSHDLFRLLQAARRNQDLHGSVAELPVLEEHPPIRPRLDCHRVGQRARHVAGVERKPGGHLQLQHQVLDLDVRFDGAHHLQALPGVPQLTNRSAKLATDPSLKCVRLALAGEHQRLLLQLSRGLRITQVEPDTRPVEQLQHGRPASDPQGLEQRLPVERLPGPEQADPKRGSVVQGVAGDGVEPALHRLAMG